MGQPGLFLPAKPVLMNHAVFSFDLSLIPLLANLAMGGHIVLNAKEAIQKENWLARLKSNAVSAWVSTPSFAYQQLLSPQFNSEYLPELGVFIFIGEVLNKALVKQPPPFPAGQNHQLLWPNGSDHRDDGG